MASVPAKRPRVLCLGEPQNVGDDFRARFAEEFDFSVLPAYTHAEMKALLPADIARNGPVDAFIIRMGTPPYEPFDEGFFSMMLPSCRVVASASAGFNEFPIHWLADRGVYFCNTVDAVAEPTADMAMFLILAAVRNTSVAERSARAGTWRNVPGMLPTMDPSGMTLGIIGLGAIGKYLAKKAAAFNLKILYYNRTRLPPEEEAKHGATYCSTLHELLAASDIVSVHCPLNTDTTELMGRAEFAAMRHGSFFVNTARGAVVDEAALKEALESGKVLRAGLDVLRNEPDVDLWFLGSDKVIVQPHVAGLTKVAATRAERECFENIRAFFRTGVPNSPVLPVDTKRSGRG